MVKLLKIIPLVLLFSFSSENDGCSILPSGHYKIVYTSNSTEISSRIVIEGNRFWQYWEGGKSAKGAIKWIQNCTLQLDYFNRTNPDTTEQSRQINRSFGDVSIELRSQQGDTILFRSTYAYNRQINI